MFRLQKVIYTINNKGFLNRHGTINTNGSSLKGMGVRKKENKTTMCGVGRQRKEKVDNNSRHYCGLTFIRLTLQFLSLNIK